MIVIASTKPYAQKMLLDAFQAFAPENSFCLPDDACATQATTAACWFPDMDQLESLPDLQLIHSMGAGVEHLDLKKIEYKYQLCRIVDAHHKQGMLNYLHWGILYYQRCFDLYAHNQQQQIWHQYSQLSEHDVKVGIMGLGEIGSFVAQKLANYGYQISGWSKSSKSIESVTCYSGEAQFEQFLSQSQILINLLPLTTETRHILSNKTFEKLPKGAAVINSGRGAHLNSNDLLACLQSGQLRGAILDVFEQEPLIPEHPLWTTQNVLITPHVASHAPLKVVVEQILENDKRLINRQPLMNVVNLQRGY
ncbi:2-hydroxyacid dehydrogenase [Acinetobacter ihumii]|uniref:2-hydroxyacid dehydrogenase n=1 Tax=Acinetobacter ihumii TaxID=2483802 RepID=UPI001031A0C1|nr:glyoxylate/hydroxypyruvate reductase A [Acinetobacter ihumii]